MDEAVEEVYEDIQRLVRQAGHNEITCVIGDFNAQIEAGVDSKEVGQYGLGNRNSTGDMLL